VSLVPSASDHITPLSICVCSLTQSNWIITTIRFDCENTAVRRTRHPRNRDGGRRKRYRRKDTGTIFAVSVSYVSYVGEKVEVDGNIVGSSVGHKHGSQRHRAVRQVL